MSPQLPQKEGISWRDAMWIWQWHKQFCKRSQALKRGTVSPRWCHLQWLHGPCTVSSSCFVWVARQVPLLFEDGRYHRGLLSKYLPCLTLGSLWTQWREIEAFRGLDFIFLVSVLGRVESCSSLARQKRSMESPDTAIHSVNASTLAKEPRPTLLCLPRLSAPAGNALVGSPGEAPQAGLDTDFGNAYLPVSLAELLWKGGHFFL